MGAIIERREAYDRQLSQQMQPILRLRETQAEAGVLVNLLDERLRTIERLRTFRRIGSPLSPLQLTNALGEGKTLVGDAVNRILANPRGSETGTIIRAILSTIFAFVLLPLLYRFVVRRLDHFFERRRSSISSKPAKIGLVLSQNLASALVISVCLLLGFVSFALALIGFADFNEAAASLEVAVFLAMMALIAKWIGNSVFHSPFPQLRIINLILERAFVASRMTLWIGLVVGLDAVLRLAEDRAVIGYSLANLLSVLIVAIGGSLAWRLASLIADPTARMEASDPETGEGGIDFASPIARLVKAIVLGAVAAALLGYAFLARQLFTSVSLTLAIIAIGVYLQKSVGVLCDSLSEGRLAAHKLTLRLVQLVSSVVITLVALPLIAIVWGYSAQEISDGLIALRSGIEFGDITLSIGDVFTFALFFVLGWIVTRWVQRILKISILPQFNLEAGALSAIVTMVGYVGIVIAALVAIGSTGLDLTSLAFVAGALSVGLGFGLQSVVENFTSGIILLLERPVREGDWIEVGEYSGIVRQISVRSTRIETWDRHFIIVPNSDLVTGKVKNFSLGEDNARVVVDVGVAYGTDLALVRRILLDIALDSDAALRVPEPFVTLEAFDDSAISLKLFTFVADVTTGAQLASDIRFEIARRFSETGIKIPFPQRDIHLRFSRNAT